MSCSVSASQDRRVSDSSHRDAQSLAHPFERFGGQPVLFGLDVEEHLDECARVCVVVVDDLVDS